MNYYERHIGDYIRDTVSLTMLEEGAYTRLMDQYYQTERPIPLDKKMIYRLARATSSAERKACDFVISSFFSESSEGYIQKRIETEISRYQAKRDKAQASANARWKKPSEGQDSDANASKTHDASDMRTQCESDALQTPVTSNQTPVTSKSKDTPRAPRFDAQAHLESLAVAPEVARDWLALRQGKRLKPTKTAFDGVQREAEKAGLSMHDALVLCCTRGWGGLEASWVIGRAQGAAPAKFLSPQERMRLHNEAVTREFLGEPPLGDAMTIDMEH